MEQIVKFTIDPKNLIAKFYFHNINNTLINDLRILLSSFSNPNYYDNIITLPLFDLRNVLSQTIQLLKKNNYKIESDEFTEKILREIVEEKKAFKDKGALHILSYKEICTYLQKIGYKRTPTRRQFRDIQGLLQKKHGANFSVPGAGKTSVLLAIHSILKIEEVVNKLFVICPINAFISWEDEVESIFGKANFKIHRLRKEEIESSSSLPSLNADIIITNYEKFRKNIKTIIPFFISNNVHLVLDESHRIKSGENNLSYNQIKLISGLAKRRDIMSGTPMPQSYTDLIPQFNFLWPGEKIIPDLAKTPPEIIPIRLNESISDMFVRTTKNELQLTDPIIHYSFIEMGPIQKELYKLFISESARVFAQMNLESKINFRKIGISVVKLLQAATNPMLLGSIDEYDSLIIPDVNKGALWELLGEYIHYEKPAKIEVLKSKVASYLSNKENKILIWSYFIKNILLLENLFKEYNPVSIYGGIIPGNDLDDETREGRIRKFHNDPSCRIIIANPQACGEGISLHKICHHAIYLDRTFNAAHYLQSIDRIHRLGLPKQIETKIDILISKDSIDQIVLKRLNDKIINMGNALNDKYLEKLAYDPEDISADDESGLDNTDLEEIKKHIYSDG